VTLNKRDNVADVLVIGSGMGGGAMSKRLSDAGISVICLEQGDWVHPTQFPHFHDEWEIEKYRKRHEKSTAGYGRSMRHA
jgi:choline dehydrogenase-like flavoprotein